MVRLQEFLDAVYEAFLDRVAAGRGLARERVQELAQGRIWSGSDAVELGLVDALGGLSDAVAEAARRAGAGIEGYRVRWLDREPSVIDRALAAFAAGEPPPLAELPASLAAAAREARALALSAGGAPPVLARLPFSLRAR
jgi:protease-4